MADTPSAPPSVDDKRSEAEKARTDPTAASNLAVQADAGAASDHPVNTGGKKAKTGPVVALHAVVHSGKAHMPGETVDGGDHEDWPVTRADLIANRMAAEPEDAESGLEQANAARERARAEAGF